MKVLLTGIGGFIAQNVGAWLVENTQHSISGTYRTKKPELEKVHMVKCDLYNDYDALNDMEFDVVVHFASQLYGDNIRAFLDNTVQATRNLLDVAEKKKVKQFVYISTISVCGETEGTINEDTKRINPNDYEITKWIGERLLESSSIKDKTIIRLPRLLGKNIDYTAPWLPKVSYSIMQNEDVYYYHPNAKYNTVCHTDDLAGFINDIIDGKIENGVYDIGADQEMSILEILEFLKDRLNSKSNLIEIDAVKADRCHSVDISKAKNAGFKADTVRNTLEKYVDDMRGE